MQQAPILYNLRPTAAQVRWTACIAVTLFAAVLLTLPFRNVELAKLNGFVPAHESLIVLGDLVTAILLFSQARIMRSMALMALATGYIYSSLIAIPHILSFPGAFSESGLLGAKLSTTAWLVFFWRLGFVTGAIAYVLLKKWPDWVNSTALQPRRVMVACIAASMALVAALVLLTTIGEPLLPNLFLDRVHSNQEPVFNLVLGLWILTIVAIGMVWRTYRSILDLGLLLTLWAMVLEISMVGAISGRYTLGWYVADLFTLISNLPILIMQLSETNRLYAQLIRSTFASERERERQLLIRDATAAAIAHELKQPLSAILLNAQFGQARGSQDDQIVSFLFKEIERDSLRAKDTIQSTRSLFANSPAAKQASDVNELIRKSLALIARDLKDENISVDLKLAKSLPAIAVNQLRMQELFLNLFTNAMEAMSGQVGKPRILTIASSLSDTGLVIRVQDTGPGIADAQIEQIFAPFYTTKDAGTGVGLTICQSIVSAHGGFLRIVSGNAEGATFEIHLPCDGVSASVEVGDFASSSSAIPPSGTQPQISS